MTISINVNARVAPDRVHPIGGQSRIGKGTRYPINHKVVPLNTLTSWSKLGYIDTLAAAQYPFSAELD
jgi:hypothetical protein